MGSKALLVLVLCMATIILISAEIAPKHLDEKSDTNHGKFDTNGIDESKYSYGGGGFGGPWRGGYGGPWRGGGGYGGPWRGSYGGYCRYGCCRWGYYGGCRRCCFYPGERVEAYVDAEPHN